MSRAFVTGAGGFVGANLVRRLLDDAHEVTAAIRPGGDRWRLEDLRADVEVVELDLRDDEAVRDVLRRSRADRVFHLAAHGAYSWQSDPRRILETNVLATEALVSAALELECSAFVHAGSSSEYGLKDHAPSETTWLDPNSHYAVAKAAATMLCRYEAIARDAHLVTLRLYSVYGPWEEPGRLVPTLVARGMAGHLPPLVDPETARDFVYVGDVCDAFVRVAERPTLPRGAVYNVGSGAQTTIRDIVEAARRVLPIVDEPAWGAFPARSWDTTSWVADASRIAADLGWSASTAIDEGLRSTAEWMGADAGLAARYAPAD